MKLLPAIIADFTERFGSRLRLPELRQIELYHRRKHVGFIEAQPSAQSLLPDMLGTLTAFSLLQGYLESRLPELEGKAGWQAYQALPRKSDTDKVVAEIFRILRVLRTAVVSPQGHLEVEHGLIRAFVTHRQCALSVTLSRLGLSLLESAVAWYLDAVNQPYPDAYVEAMLLSYFADIVEEIKRFNDEDRVLYQFGRRLTLNRLRRLDCDNPKCRIEDGVCILEIARPFTDAVQYPLDIYLTLDGALYIIPIEAAPGGRLAAAEMDRWKARTGDGVDLPPHFALRFGREPVVVGQPMV
ncbi:MAG TPA: hypothetical protein VM661_00090 [Candidatus Sulfotelmatobacter sp.]|jgi:hypothetical protein|nr:hypothetical protein [Candidatus Sulfotelmatobacter sp.]